MDTGTGNGFLYSAGRLLWPSLLLVCPKLRSIAVDVESQVSQEWLGRQQRSMKARNNNNPVATNDDEAATTWL